MKRIKIARLLDAKTPLERVLVKGWVRTRRDSKGFSFIEINDGSCLKNLQVIADWTEKNREEIKRLSTGAAVQVAGALMPSKGGGQKWEVKAEEVRLLGESPDDYPLQKKRHTDEFLRQIGHLRPRTNKYGAMFRIRSELSQTIHSFFHERGFYYLHSPIITGSDCEGAGEMFRVTTLDPERGPAKEDQPVSDFFGKTAGLTVSGQLSAEMFALSLGDVYTFGPTFRAENSNTRRHAAEFWMVEPEMAFCDLEGNMDLGEEMIREITKRIMDSCEDDLALFDKFVSKGLLKRLAAIVGSDFVRLPYTEAVEILGKSKQKFEYPCHFGADLQTEHERYLTEKHFQKPVIVYDYPKTIKAFYMRLNEDDATVAAMDVLVPGIGEIIGGSQREERLSVLEARIKETGMDPADYWWYLDARKFGTAEHSGFGLGFERFLMLITGVENIRDVIPFPRTPGSIEF